MDVGRVQVQPSGLVIQTHVEQEVVSQDTDD